jgi:hypothetical protein
MNLATLAIQVEAWLQEESQAARTMLALLERTETAARSGESAELARCASELTSQLAAGGARHGRRTALTARLAAFLAVPVQGLNLAKFAARLRAERLDATRFESLRAEVRESATAVVRASRRLAAMAQYHRGLLAELCQLLQSEAHSGGQLVDARG